MAPTLAQTQKGYASLFDNAKITKPADAAKLADRMHADSVRTRHEAIEAEIGTPWFFSCALHVRESNLAFGTHLHCGDSLKARTYHVPKGRPKAEPRSGHLPYTWEESAVDALTMPGKQFQQFKGKWTLELMLFCSEGYNGWGYLRKGNSPYIWSWTDQYHGGKYVSDGVYSASAWDVQPGVVAMYKALADKDPAVRSAIAHRAGRDEPLPKPAEQNATRKERNVTKGGGAGAAAGGASTASTTKDGSVGHLVWSVAEYTLIGVGVAVAIIGAVFLVRKTQAARARWEQLKGV